MEELSNPKDKELDNYTTEDLTKIMECAVGRKDYVLVGKISVILVERSTPPQGPSVSKVPRLEIVVVAENKSVSAQVPAILTSLFKWDLTPIVVTPLPPPPTAGGCICHGWVRPADATLGSIIHKAVKKAVGWIEEKDGCESQIKMSEKYMKWRKQNDQKAKPGPKKSCRLITFQGKTKSLYFTDGRLRIKTGTRGTNTQLCSWANCWEVKQRNCADHQQNMWRITAVGLFQNVEDEDNENVDVMGVVQPTVHSMNRYNTICTTWVDKRTVFKRILEKHSLDITNVEILHRFEELANGAYDDRLRHTLKLGIDLLTFFRNLNLADGSNYTVVPFDNQLIRSASLSHVLEFLSNNGIQVGQGDTVLNKIPPFSDNEPLDLVGLPLPH
ncbi:uncharacterized protein LOC118435372 [Folsomia candida]|uniref:uncharacterized protein LOC118435372 n=1 Tax=Folsomia candida TaxID=158441 RepID=UPI001604DCB0|nr:uncharacterized protein LOC118435372 [Folsomia candida]